MIIVYQKGPLRAEVRDGTYITGYIGFTEPDLQEVLATWTNLGPKGGTDTQHKQIPPNASLRDSLLAFGFPQADADRMSGF